MPRHRSWHCTLWAHGSISTQDPAWNQCKEGEGSNYPAHFCSEKKQWGFGVGYACISPIHSFHSQQTPWDWPCWLSCHFTQCQQWDATVSPWTIFLYVFYTLTFLSETWKINIHLQWTKSKQEDSWKGQSPPAEQLPASFYCCCVHAMKKKNITDIFREPPEAFPFETLSSALPPVARSRNESEFKNCGVLLP